MEGTALIDLVSILPALAIAALFVWFDLKHQEQWKTERIEIREQWKTEREATQKQFMQFLTEQRVAMLTSMDVMAIRLKELGDIISGMDDRTKRIEKTFDQHDTRAENIGIAVAEIRARLNGKPLAQIEKEKQQSETK